MQMHNMNNKKEKMFIVRTCESFDKYNYVMKTTKILCL